MLYQRRLVKDSKLKTMKIYPSTPLRMTVSLSRRASFVIRRSLSHGGRAMVGEHCLTISESGRNA